MQKIPQTFSSYIWGLFQPYITYSSLCFSQFFDFRKCSSPGQNLPDSCRYKWLQCLALAVAPGMEHLQLPRAPCISSGCCHSSCWFQNPPPAVPLLCVQELTRSWDGAHFLNEHKLGLDGTCKKIQRTGKSLFKCWCVFVRAAKQFSLPLIQSTKK